MGSGSALTSDPEEAPNPEEAPDPEGASDPEEAPADTEDRLQGGNISGEIVRIGATVRRPTGPWSPSVHALLRHLEQRRFTGAPKLLGVDDEGREVVEYIPGEVPWPAAHRRLLGSAASVVRMGRLLRAFHRAVADFDAGDDAIWQFPEMAADALVHADERGLIICHNDATAWNLVIGDQRWAFIDWDAAGPRPPIWDVAYCAIGVIPISPDTAAAGWPGPVPVVERLTALAGGYQLANHDRQRLPEVIVARIRSSYEHLQRRAMAGIAPWDALWRSGHGDSWARMLGFAEAHAPSWVVGLD
jgi:aminoglycoside phosphotransferase (APT) family kinase protein